MKFSIIIPVYNRPDEIDELLESLLNQTYENFEVLVIEDGSTIPCESIVRKYMTKLNVQYFFKNNTGQGFSRNYGYERATGDYLIVFDSDCIIPPGYLDEVKKYLDSTQVDAFGGPDRAHDSFTNTQKAINCAMTSLFTTGGTRGSKLHVGAYRPRSFNMGMTPEVFRKTGGYIITRMAEDLELSIRINKAGFKIDFIENAFVYHKRRTTFLSFYKQIHFFGRGRINLSRFFPGEVRFIHLFPLVFTVGFIILFFLPLVSIPLFYTGLMLLAAYFLLVWADAMMKSKNIIVSFMVVYASLLLMVAYGTGFAREGIKKLLEK